MTPDEIAPDRAATDATTDGPTWDVISLRSAVVALTVERDEARAEADRLRDACTECGSSLVGCLTAPTRGGIKCCPDCRHLAEKEAWDRLRARAEAAEAEVGRLRAAVDQDNDLNDAWQNDLIETLDPWVTEVDEAQEAIITAAVGRVVAEVRSRRACEHEWREEVAGAVRRAERAEAEANELRERVADLEGQLAMRGTP